MELAKGIMRALLEARCGDGVCVRVFPDGMVQAKASDPPPSLAELTRLSSLTQTPSMFLAPQHFN